MLIRIQLRRNTESLSYCVYLCMIVCHVPGFLHNRNKRIVCTGTEVFEDPAITKRFRYVIKYP